MADDRTPRLLFETAVRCRSARPPQRGTLPRRTTAAHIEVLETDRTTARERTGHRVKDWIDLPPAFRAPLDREGGDRTVSDDTEGTR